MVFDNLSHQSIVILGTSGSGKTSTRNSIIQYLMFASRSPEPAYSQVYRKSTSDQKFLSALSILELFGSIRTRKGRLVSACGDYTSLYFDARGGILALQIYSVTFESSRAVRFKVTQVLTSTLISFYILSYPILSFNLYDNF